ncbi:hypothetical protein D8674_001399 [Pyrus ussuriensis x Pyrus communis]|uniref:Uncharacterized protein n=1 Tax=Pyrus ussuriensis x Pyrus communis TaxID=2448454 RepID=A0A5N5F604_9ROSA|nr:hypothetical protein D8674_001399 [Pyrus ussuriensis x Pyrus communis]
MSVSSVIELLENSTTKVIEYGRKHVEGRDGDSTDVGKSGDPFSRLLGPKEEEEGVNNMKLALAKDILDDDDNGVQDYDSPRTTRMDMLSMPTRGLCWSKNCAGKDIRVMDFGMKCRGYHFVLLKRAQHEGAVGLPCLEVLQCGVVQEKRF